MSSDISTKRGLVLKAYPNSKTWPARVAKMPDNQIVALFFRFVREGKIRT